MGIKEYYNGDIPFIRLAEINSSHTELFIAESDSIILQHDTLMKVIYYMQCMVLQMEKWVEQDLKVR